MVALLPARTPLSLPSAVSVSNVFSTDLWTGDNNNYRTITTGTNVSNGLVWLTNRDVTMNNLLADPVRGMGYYLYSDFASAQIFQGSGARSVQSMNNGSYVVGNTLAANRSPYNHVGWSFAESPRFLDVFSYTGNGTDNRELSHNLGVTPGMIAIREYNTAASWQIYHRSVEFGTGNHPKTLEWDLGTASADDQTFIRDSGMSASTFKISDDAEINQSGQAYIAYVFAHDPYPDGVIQCGSYTGNGSTSGPSVHLGWEPQYLMIKRADGVGNWYVLDAERGWDKAINIEHDDPEVSGTYLTATSTGFDLDTSDSNFNASGSQYIYMAIKAA